MVRPAESLFETDECGDMPTLKSRRRSKRTQHIAKLIFTSLDGGGAKFRDELGPFRRRLRHAIRKRDCRQQVSFSARAGAEDRAISPSVASWQNHTVSQLHRFKRNVDV